MNGFRKYYENDKITFEYRNFIISNIFDYSKNQDKITRKNTMKFSLLIKYFQTIYELKVQKQIFGNIIEIKDGLIKLEENNILIKNISESETLYQKELLKLIDRSIAENLIVYPTENYPNNFCKIDLSLNIYNHIKKYYKYNKEGFEKFKKKIQRK